MGTAKRERQKQGRLARLEQARVVETRRKRFRTVRNAGLVVVIVLVALFLFAQAQDDDDPVATTPGSTVSTVLGETTSSTPGDVLPFTYGTTPCPAADGSSERTLAFEDAPQQCIDPAKTYTAVLDTTHGEIEVALDVTNTPGTTNNFVALSRYHYYDGTDIFRSNTGIGILQGGSPNTQTNSDPGPGYNLQDEGFDFDAIGGVGGPYRYNPGDLVMARGGVANGASAQWFFCVDLNCANLDSQGVYVKFGSVVAGQDVLDAILALHEDTGTSPGEGAPSEQVTVNSITIRES